MGKPERGLRKARMELQHHKPKKTTYRVERLANTSSTIPCAIRAGGWGEIT